MLAVKLVSTMSANLSSMSPLTVSPRGVERRYLPSLMTYSRSRMVLTVGA